MNVQKSTRGFLAKVMKPDPVVSSGLTREACQQACNMLEHLSGDAKVGKHLQEFLIANCRALIFTWTLKAGMGIGYSGGHGFIIGKVSKNEWSAPCFLKMSSAQAGLILGVEKVIVHKPILLGLECTPVTDKILLNLPTNEKQAILSVLTIVSAFIHNSPCHERRLQKLRKHLQIDCSPTCHVISYAPAKHMSTAMQLKLPMFFQCTHNIEDSIALFVYAGGDIDGCQH